MNAEDYFEKVLNEVYDCSPTGHDKIQIKTRSENMAKKKL